MLQIYHYAFSHDQPIYSCLGDKPNRLGLLLFRNCPGSVRLTVCGETPGFLEIVQSMATLNQVLRQLTTARDQPCRALGASWHQAQVSAGPHGSIGRKRMIPLCLRLGRPFEAGMC